MRILFLGPPGAGKGTQAGRLSKRIGVPHIATGNMLRETMIKETPLGREVRSCIESGKLVPDDRIIDVVCERLRGPDLAKGYILDGFPRTIKQAEALSDFENQSDMKTDRVIYFSLPEAELVKRISGRRSCPVCSRIYHLLYDPAPQKDVCVCGVQLIQRKDDSEETVVVRFSVYHRETAPVIQYYERLGLLAQVDATQTISDVFSSVCKAAGVV